MSKLDQRDVLKSRTRRLQSLRASVAEKGLDSFMVSQLDNVRYLSGFTGSSGWLFISGQNAVLATDFRFVEQAKGESPDFQIIRTKGEMCDWLPCLASDMGWHRLGFEASFTSYESYRKLSEATGVKQVNLSLVPTTGTVEQLRSIKEHGELKYIMEAVGLADAAFEEVKAMIRPGITEKEIAWEIETALHQKGSEGVSFEIIVASGPNSALPHARTTDKAICSGEPVIIDMGARVGGYCSDLSRTLFFGRADKMFQKVYDIVLRAQTAALEGIRSGMAASQADRLARSIIEQAGYAESFGHGVGHGVGLAVHEFPTVNPNSSDDLADGMVFTIEPGVYLAGQGGVRIEDMVVLENGRPRVLTKAEKNSFQLPCSGNR